MISGASILKLLPNGMASVITLPRLLTVQDDGTVGQPQTRSVKVKAIVLALDTGHRMELPPEDFSLTMSLMLRRGALITTA